MTFLYTGVYTEYIFLIITSIYQLFIFLLGIGYTYQDFKKAESFRFCFFYALDYIKLNDTIRRGGNLVELYSLLKFL